MNVLGEATTKESWNKLGDLYHSKSLLTKYLNMEEVVKPEDEIWRLGNRAFERLQYYGKLVSIC